jgi:hypothetical protein
MKRGLKITLISVGSLLALLLAAIAVVVWYVFTPEKLTPIVREQAAKYLKCDSQIGQVDLTFFSTFPEFGLRLTDVVLSSPMPGDEAATDTIAALKECIAVVDPIAFLNDGSVVVKRFMIDGVQAHLSTAADGTCNFDILNIESTTEESEKDEDSSFSLGQISLADISVQDLNLRYCDETTGLGATLQDASLALSLDGALGDDMNPVQLSSEGITLQVLSCAYSDSSYQVAVEGLKTTIQPLNMDRAQLRLGVQLTLDSANIVMAGESPLCAEVRDASLSLPLVQHDEDWQIQVETAVSDLWVALGSEVYLDHRPLRASVEAQANDSLTEINVSQAQIQCSDLAVGLQAHVALPDSTTTRVAAQFNMDNTQISDIWALLPQSVASQLSDLTLNGQINIAGAAAVTQSASGLSIDSFSVKSALEDIVCTMGKSLKVKATANQVQLNYPVAEHAASIAASLDLQDLFCQIQDSTTTEAHFDQVHFSGYIADQLLNGSTDIPKVDASWSIAQLKTAIDDQMSAEGSKLAGTVTIPGGKSGGAIPTMNATLSLAALTAQMDTMSLTASQLTGRVGVVSRIGKPTRYQVEYGNGTLDARMGSALSFVTDALKLTASVSDEPVAATDADEEALTAAGLKKLLLTYDPVLTVELENGVLTSSDINLPILLPVIDFHFNLGKCTINNSQVRIGNSDFALNGDITNLRPYLRGQELLTGRMDFTSNMTDVYQLMDLVNGFGVTDSTEVEVATTDTTATDGDPFMVPKGIDFALTTQIKHAWVGENDFSNLGGKLTVRDGVLVLEEMGFSSKAARMQLTAMYKSEMRNHLFVGANFHLLDIEIADLLQLIPDIDTIVPMLKSFDGKAEFHLAAETNLTANYEPKWSTLKATAAIEGKDLILMDNETFSTLAKYLMFNKKTENKVDSLSVEMAVARRKATIYPFLITMDKYQAVIAGTHNITGNMGFNYNVSITDWPLPGIHPGVDVTGDMDDLSFKVLAKGKYANLYKPAKRNATQAQTLELKALINQALKRTVKEQEPATETLEN